MRWMLKRFRCVQIFFKQQPLRSRYHALYTHAHTHIYIYFNLTYSRRTSSLPSCLWSLRIFPSLPGSRLTIFYRDASSARARSLRNLLVSGNECGRVFPAGVGPGSPSRDAANWLPSRFSLLVETRRRYGWLRMVVFPGARLSPSPNLVPFGRVAARERQGALSRRAW